MNCEMIGSLPLRGCPRIAGNRDEGVSASVSVVPLGELPNSRLQHSWRSEWIPRGTIGELKVADVGSKS